jgi:hypothetical protein
LSLSECATPKPQSIAPPSKPFATPTDMNNAQKKVATAIDALLDQATRHALALIESEARRILRANNPAKSFCMAMGGASFYDASGNSLWDDHPAFKSFYSFLNEYDRMLCLTGTPMKIKSADGPLITEW